MDPSNDTERNRSFVFFHFVSVSHLESVEEKEESEHLHLSLILSDGEWMLEMDSVDSSVASGRDERS